MDTVEVEKQLASDLGDDAGGEAPAAEGSETKLSAREKMIRAAKAAGGEPEKPGGADGAAEGEPEAPAGKANAPKEDEEPAEAGEQDEKKELSKKEKLDRALAAREKARSIVAEAEEYAKKTKADYETVQAAASQLREAEKQLRAGFAELEELRRDPIKVIRKFGWSPQDIVDAAVNEKDPQYQAKRQYEDRFSEYDRKLAELAEENKALKAKAASYDEQAQSAAVQAAEQKFLGLFPKESAARRIWDDEYLVARAYKVQEQYVARHGKKPTLDSLWKHLEYEATERIGGSVTPEQDAGSGQKIAGQSKASKTRALSTRDASEHRGGSPKSFHDLPASEQRKQLVAAAKTAARGG